jgi:hypothetical protein
VALEIGKLCVRTSFVGVVFINTQKGVKITAVTVEVKVWPLDVSFQGFLSQGQF